MPHLQPLVRHTDTYHICVKSVRADIKFPLSKTPKTWYTLSKQAT